jgi:dihydroorotate dehydrogenase
MYKILLKKLLFLFPAERAHHLTVSLLKAMLVLPGLQRVFHTLYQVQDPRLHRQVMGLHFPNPVGLAAGFDKDGNAFSQMAALGFGFIELGTVTPKPQPGNPTPRLFRLPQDFALINRMGFNNDGVEALATRLRNTKRPRNLVLGGNIGKNKTTPNELALEDYRYAFQTLFPYVDYFVVNVSSPNTPDLRALQDKEPLKLLLDALQAENYAQPTPKPILLKIAPDLSLPQLDDILDLVRSSGIAGIVATNTTVERTGLSTPPHVVNDMGAGGLSGTPLRKRATEIIRYLRQHGPAGMTIIGVGGIGSPESAREKLEAGADLIQLYTGLVYEGPGLVKRILRNLSAR